MDKADTLNCGDSEVRRTRLMCSIMPLALYNWRLQGKYQPAGGKKSEREPL